MKTSRIILITFGLFILLSPGAVAQPDSGPAIDRETKEEIIDSVTTAFDSIYVYPEKAEEIDAYLRERLDDGAYDDAGTVGEFAMMITRDMHEVTGDRHIGVRYFAREEIERRLSDSLQERLREEDLDNSRFENFGFEKVERLPGNIGYLKFNGFSGWKEAGATAIGAMRFLNNVDALIIDLTENGGGSPHMIQILTSYFFEEPTHLNTFYIRATDSLQQFWTTNYVEGEKMVGIPLYVLTSTRTFSAAEEFTYNLKNLKRATIVGETTGGGAHPVESHFFANLEIGVRVPFGKAVNPISGINWEGTGIEPDIACSAAEALDQARLDALRKLRDQATDEERAAAYTWQAETFETLLNPHEVSAATMQEYAGDYGPRHVTYEEGALYYQRDERPKYRMIPMSDDTFCFEDIDYFRLKFIRDGGEVVRVEGHYMGGRVDSNTRDEGRNK